MKHYPTLIIGAGPSGLCCSYYLKKAGIPHLILEKDVVLHTWKNERWDSFSLVTPNWMTRLPGMEDLTPQNNEFMTKQEVVHILETFAERIQPEVLEHTEVESIERESHGFTVKTNHGVFIADNVIVSIGLFNTPKIPECSKELPATIKQIHSVDYKNPQQLIDGNVLVIGAGRSGVQIAYEIKKQTDRDVWLALGTLRPIPSVYQFTNGVYWLNRLAGFTHFEGALPYKPEDAENHNIMGKLIQNLGGCVNLGVHLTGRFTGYYNSAFHFQGNLKHTLKEGNKYLAKFQKVIDDHMEHHQMKRIQEASVLNLPELQMDALSDIKLLEDTQCQIRNVIWCTGFQPDYTWIHLDVFDTKGFPIHSHGKTDCQGLYFTGLSLDPGFGGRSGFGIGLFAISEDARHVVSEIVKTQSKTD